MKFIIEAPAADTGGKRKVVETFNDLETAQKYVEGTRFMIRWKPSRGDTADAGGVMASANRKDRNYYGGPVDRLAA